jgi:hypothetical protein
LGIRKNKVQKSGVFLTSAKAQFFHHVSPRISPHFYHQKTTLNQPLFCKTPSKTQQKRQKRAPPHRSIFPPKKLTA